MKLSQAAKINVRLICFRCSGHQPGYILQLLEDHDESADLQVVLKVTPCMWCKNVGDLRIGEQE